MNNVWMLHGERQPEGCVFWHMFSGAPSWTPRQFRNISRDQSASLSWRPLPRDRQHPSLARKGIWSHNPDGVCEKSFPWAAPVSTVLSNDDPLVKRRFLAESTIQ